MVTLVSRHVVMTMAEASTGIPGGRKNLEDTVPLSDKTQVPCSPLRDKARMPKSVALWQVRKWSKMDLKASDLWQVLQISGVLTSLPNLMGRECSDNGACINENLRMKK